MDKAYDIKLHEIEVELYKATKVQPIPPEYEIPTMYEGVTVVSPSRELQTLETAGKKISENITVSPIDDNLQDVSGVTATPEDVLNGVKFVDNKGTLQNGEIENKGTVSNILNTQNKAVELQKGYYEGGSVSVDSKELTVTTNGEYQDENFKFYNRVNVNVQTNITEDWQRPSIYPDYSKINLDEGENVCYLTYDCRDAIKGVPAQMACFYASASAYLEKLVVERGNIVNGEFVATFQSEPQTQRITIDEDLPTDEGDFIVYRVHGVDGGILKSIQFTSNDMISSTQQPCIEIYGKFSFIYLAIPVFMQYVTVYGYDGSFAFQNARSLQGFDIKSDNDLSMSFSAIFRGCSSLKKIDLSKIKSIKTTTMNQCLQDATNLENINFGNINTEDVTAYSYFLTNTKLVTLNLNNLSFKSCTTASYMLYNNAQLKELDMSEIEFPTSLTFPGSFSGLSSLIELKLPVMYQSFSFSNSNFLSKESLLDMFNKLYNYTTNTQGIEKPSSLTATIGSTNKAKLTAEEISIATEKGWSVA